MLAAVALSGCGEPVAPADSADTSSPGPIESDAASAGGLTTTPAQDETLYADFPECDALPDQEPYDAVEGMVPLGEMWVERVSETPPLTTVTGLVDANPIQLREQFAGDADVEVVYVEDEGYEVEILIDVGGRRTYVKATVRCQTGSIFAQIIGPEGQADLLPVPGGQG